MRRNPFRPLAAVVMVSSFVVGVPSVVPAGDAVQRTPAPQQCVPVVYICA